MRWSLVVLRKAIFQVNSVVISLKSTVRLVQQLPCAAPQIAAGSLLSRHPKRRLSHTVLCCKPPEKATVTEHRPAAVKWLPVNEPWANQTKAILPLLCACKEEGCEYFLPSLGLPVACPVAVLPWKPICSTLYHPQRSQQSHPVQPPTCLSSSSVC